MIVRPNPIAFYANMRKKNAAQLLKEVKNKMGNTNHNADWIAEYQHRQHCLNA